MELSDCGIEFSEVVNSGIGSYQVIMVWLRYCQEVVLGCGLSRMADAVVWRHEAEWR